MLPHRELSVGAEALRALLAAHFTAQTDELFQECGLLLSQRRLLRPARYLSALQHLCPALALLFGLCDRGGLPFHPLGDVLSLAQGPSPHQVRCAFACGGALRLRSRRPAEAAEALAL